MFSGVEQSGLVPSPCPLWCSCKKTRDSPLAVSMHLPGLLVSSSRLSLCTGLRCHSTTSYLHARVWTASGSSRPFALFLTLCPVSALFLSSSPPHAHSTRAHVLSVVGQLLGCAGPGAMCNGGYNKIAEQTVNGVYLLVTQQCPCPNSEVLPYDEIRNNQLTSVQPRNTAPP